MAITPEGYISACTEVTRRNDPLSEIFFFGHVDLEREEVEIEQSKLLRLRGRNIYTLQQCANCYAKYYCMGGCPARATREVGFGNIQDATCYLSKQLLELSFDMFVQGRSTFRFIFEPIPFDLES